MRNNFIVFLLVLFLLLTCCPVILGIGYLEFFQGQRAFVRCVETGNKNIMVIDYKKIDDGFYFSYAQIPDADYNSSWKTVADCQDKYLDKTDLYIEAVVFEPIQTIDDNKIHFFAYVYFQAVFSEEDLKHVDDVNYIAQVVRFQAFDQYQLGFIMNGTKYSFDKYIGLMRNYYAKSNN